MGMAAAAHIKRIWPTVYWGMAETSSLQVIDLPRSVIEILAPAIVVAPGSNYKNTSTEYVQISCKSNTTYSLVM
jgi:hypothetical protein